MAASKQNFPLFQGDDGIPVQFTILDDAGLAVDVSTAHFTWVLARTEGAVPRVTKTDADDINLSDPTHGIIQVIMRKADTDGISGAWYHELSIVLTGETLTVAYGTVTINKTSIPGK